MKLDQHYSSLLLFSLYQRVGEKTAGQPVTEGLAGMLVWQPKPTAKVKVSR